MPALKIYTDRKNYENPNKVGKSVSEAVLRAVPIPFVNIFYIHVEKSYFSNGIDSKNDAILEMEGPDISPDAIADLCFAATKAFREACENDACEVTFIYHGNPATHIGTEKVMVSGKLNQNKL